jgi:hypothetical protein
MVNRAADKQRAAGPGQKNHEDDIIHNDRAWVLAADFRFERAGICNHEKDETTRKNSESEMHVRHRQEKGRWVLIFRAFSSFSWLFELLLLKQTYAANAAGPLPSLQRRPTVPVVVRLDREPLVILEN